jgi:hypothetical protein
MDSGASHLKGTAVSSAVLGRYARSPAHESDDALQQLKHALVVPGSRGGS